MRLLFIISLAFAPILSYTQTVWQCYSLSDLKEVEWPSTYANITYNPSVTEGESNVSFSPNGNNPKRSISVNIGRTSKTSSRCVRYTFRQSDLSGLNSEFTLSFTIDGQILGGYHFYRNIGKFYAVPLGKQESSEFEIVEGDMLWMNCSKINSNDAYLALYHAKNLSVEQARYDYKLSTNIHSLFALKASFSGGSTSVTGVFDSFNCSHYNDGAVIPVDESLKVIGLTDYGFKYAICSPKTFRFYIDNLKSIESFSIADKDFFPNINQQTGLVEVNLEALNLSLNTIYHFFIQYSTLTDINCSVISENELIIEEAAVVNPTINPVYICSPSGTIAANVDNTSPITIAFYNDDNFNIQTVSATNATQLFDGQGGYVEFTSTGANCSVSERIDIPMISLDNNGMTDFYFCDCGSSKFTYSLGNLPSLPSDVEVTFEILPSNSAQIISMDQIIVNQPNGIDQYSVQATFTNPSGYNCMISETFTVENRCPKGSRVRSTRISNEINLYRFTKSDYGAACPSCNYEWDFGNGITTSGIGLKEVDYEFPEPGIYNVTVTITPPNDGKCIPLQKTASDEVHVINLDGCCQD